MKRIFRVLILLFIIILFIFLFNFFINKESNNTEISQTISNEEKVLMDMLNSENWNIAEISRNFLRGFDSNVTRSQLSDNESKKLADIDFVRNSYECTPYTKMITLIVLTLLRKRRIVIM